MPQGEIDAHALLELARDAARAAGEVLLARYRGPARGVGTKSSGTDMVSDADREAQRAALERIAGERPEDGVLAEEAAGERAGSSGLRWVVDPLDGTTNYLYGVPAWVVSVACEDAAGALAGVVHDPLRGETFCAVRGAGATLAGEPIAASSRDALSSALVATGFSYDRGERALQAAAVQSILPSVRDLRRSGSAARDLAWVACGRYDGYYEVPVMPWDRAAGELLVCEAGGEVARLGAIGPSGDGTVAAGRLLFEPLAALVGRANGTAAGWTGERDGTRWDTL
jgi:myo-inositol-1(or 4)-monophosphatase